MSTDQYPEVSGDDSGLVPQQAAPKPEWPKKIRTLTAAELDRLTIDGDGRFYWDGRLVNYEGHASKAPEARSPDPVDLDALALLDRAARELSDRNPNDGPAAASTDATVTAMPQPAVTSAAELPSPGEVPPTVVADTPRVAAPPPAAVPLHVPVEKVGFRLSFWQSIGLVLVILVLLVGSIGIAVSGLVAAHEWGCRTGIVKQYCPPPPPAPKPPVRTDIPA
jgi:hypothetical protein